MTTRAARRLNAVRVVALVLAIGLVPLALGVVMIQSQSRAHADAALDRALAGEAGAQATALENYFGRARSVMLLAAQESAFQRFYELPGSRASKVAAGGPVMDKVNDALGYLEELYPGSIGEACFIDRSGAENARVVRGERAPLADLSLEEDTASFFAPTFAAQPGQVVQAEPYESPDTGEWVISNSTPIPAPDGGATQAILHFEITIESFRRRAAGGGRYTISVVSARTGQVAFSSDRSQRRGDPLGGPQPRRIAALAAEESAAGVGDFDGRRSAFRRLDQGEGNGNDWYVVASAAPAPGPGFGGPALLFALATAGVLLLLGFLAARRWQGTKDAALIDSLTGLRNHRAFQEDLDRQLERARRDAVPLSLVLLDLNGLKETNDRLGHQAGDERLQAVATALRGTLRKDEPAYRIGGDEFAIALRATPAWGAFQFAQRLHAVLDRDGAPSVGAGVAELEPGRGRDELIRCADLAMMEAKRSRRGSLIYSHSLEPLAEDRDLASEQQHLNALATALARAVDAKDSYTRSHCETVSELSALMGEELKLAPERIAKLRLAGLLHDVGKIGVPDVILQKPAALTDEEFAQIKSHAGLGYRVLSGTDLIEEAPWVLHHHERVDGRGYPDGLTGTEIPLESRVIHVADAFEAMTSDRPYRKGIGEEAAVDELWRHAGSQFDTRCVAALVAALGLAGEDRGSQVEEPPSPERRRAPVEGEFIASRPA